ncbi:TraK family protein [Citrobacter freundii]|nr:TraK-like family protein [Klebsiella oxytoca]
MAKRLTERIAALQQAQKPTRSGQNRAAFLALRDDITEALADGWSVKTVWQTLHEEGKISFGYDAFISYVNRLIRDPASAPDTTTPAPQKTKPVSSAVKAPAPKPAMPAAPISAKPTGIQQFNHNPKPNLDDLL